MLKITYLRAMRIPQSFSRCLRFSLNITFSDVILCGVPFRLFDFGPAASQHLRDDIHATDLSSAKVPRDIIAGRNAVRRGK